MNFYRNVCIYISGCCCSDLRCGLSGGRLSSGSLRSRVFFFFFSLGGRTLSSCCLSGSIFINKITITVISVVLIVIQRV